jgi:glutathione S-transferase
MNRARQNVISVIAAINNGAACIFENTAIMEYIEERWPIRPCAQNAGCQRPARMTEDVCDT